MVELLRNVRPKEALLSMSEHFMENLNVNTNYFAFKKKRYINFLK